MKYRYTKSLINPLQNSNIQNVVSRRLSLKQNMSRIFRKSRMELSFLMMEGQRLRFVNYFSLKCV